MGLGVVQRLASILDANLTVASRINRGSRFSIQLPPSRPIETNSPVQINKVGFHDLKVLCVDDQSQNLDALQSLLVKWKVVSHCEQTPNAALASLVHFVPDVILMDFQLSSDIDGLQLIEQLRERISHIHANHVPAILITANIEPELVQRCKEQGCGYLSKPVKPAKLRALLQAAQAEVVRQ